MNDKPVKGHAGLIKRNNAVVDTNNKAYEAAKNRKNKEKTILDLIEKTDLLEKSVDDINGKLLLILDLLQRK